MGKGLKNHVTRRIRYENALKEMMTFTTRLSRRVYVVDLGDLLVSLLPSGIAEVHIYVDTTCVIEVWSSGTLRS